MDVTQENRLPAYKRPFDVFMALLGLLLSTPLLVVIASVIKLTSRGPVFFVQVRSGYRGEPFPIFKFRTMRVGDHSTVGSETTADDPRITRVGHGLRRTGLDELPQLINVLLGQMSIVGPRPLLAWENEMCNERERRRLHVKPGITGLAQIKGRNAISWTARVEWDVRYVERLSLPLDLWILLRTILTVFRGENAFAPNGSDIYGGRTTGLDG